MLNQSDKDDNSESHEAGTKRKCALSKVDGGANRKPKGRKTTLGRDSVQERLKITRACDACKLRKSRCSGTLPCNRCAQLSILCKYNLPHRRGQPPSPSRRPSVWLDGQPLHSQPPIESGDALEISTSELLQPEPDRNLLQSTRSSPGRDTANVEGQYIGPTSGLAFLHRAKKRLRKDFSSSARRGIDTPRAPSSIFTFGDKPYPNYSSSILVLPGRQQAREYVKRYFEFSIPTYRFLHQATVEEWLESFMNESDNDGNKDPPITDGKAAVVLMVLATATLYRVDDEAALHDAEVEESAQSGIFYSEAERRLTMETGPARLESVQARLAQCLFLMSSSRTNQAWYLFGTTAQLILSLGLHNKRHSRNSHEGSGLIEMECRRRVFWSAYTLDKYFNIILGRPGMFRDEDVDQQFPARLNDSELGMDNGRKRPGWNQCVMDAPVYHITLSRIISGICNDLYSIRPKSYEDQLVLAEKRTAELKAWKDSLPAFLNPSKVDPFILVPIFQRQSTVLTLAYAHALVLANRQFLLSNFIDLACPAPSTDERVEIRIQECVEAALNAVDTVINFVENGMLYRTFWFSQYISFCAIATLYVYTIRQYQAQQVVTEQIDVNHASRAPKRDQTECFEAAERCRALIASKTENNSPSRRYSIILDELKRQVLAEIQGISSGPPNYSALSHSGFHGTNVTNENRSDVIPDRLRFGNDHITTVSHFPNRQQEYLDLGVPGGVSLESAGELTSTMDLSLLQNSNLDSEQFGFSSDFVGWPDLDSWAMAWPDIS